MKEDNLKSNRGLVTRKPLSNAIDKELYDKLNALSSTTRINKSKLLDEALELLFEKYKDLLDSTK